ncbi:phage tail protein [Vibrio cholerae]
MHKLQNGSQVSVRPPRKPLVGLGGYFSESNDQGAPSYPGQDWFNDCTDEFLNALAAAGIEYEHGRLDHLARMISGSNFAWLSMPIGLPFALALHIPGVEPPPTDNPKIRYIKLSSNDLYNGGILINEVVTGTAPVLSVTAEINFPSSPIHGQRIELRNTSKVFSRPGTNSGVVIGDTIRNFTATINTGVGAASDGGAFTSANGIAQIGTANSRSFLRDSSATGRSPDVTLDASRQLPTSNQVQPIHIEEPYFMRVF